jgi:hypothetical protein
MHRRRLGLAWRVFKHKHRPGRTDRENLAWNRKMKAMTAFDPRTSATYVPMFADIGAPIRVRSGYAGMQNMYVSSFSDISITNNVIKDDISALSGKAKLVQEAEVQQLTFTNLGMSFRF